MLTEYPVGLEDKIEYDDNGQLRLKKGATEEEKRMFNEHMKLLKSVEKIEIPKSIKEIINY